MNKILMSACLIGEKVRYDGGDKLQNHPRLKKWLDDGKIISICPETAGGLSIPRLPSEIPGGYTGQDVLKNRAQVVDKNGGDVTSQFLQGAQETLKLALEHQIKVAILKAKSPSCGVLSIYDGTFSGNLIKGMGVTAALLKENGIAVFDEDHIDDALDLAESHP